MKPNVNGAKAPIEAGIDQRGEAAAGPATKDGAKNEVQKDLKSVPMPELEKKLGSSPDGLTQAEAQKRLTQYGPNEIAEKKDNPFLKFLSYFWGPIPWMIEGGSNFVGRGPPLAGFFIILLLLVSNAVVGFGKSTRRATRSPRCGRPSWPSRPKSNATASGPILRRRNWYRATSFG